MDKKDSTPESTEFRLSKKVTFGGGDLGCFHCINVLAWGNLEPYDNGAIIELPYNMFDCYGGTLAHFDGNWYFNITKLPEYCTKRYSVYKMEDGRIIEGLHEEDIEHFLTIHPNLEEWKDQIDKLTKEWDRSKRSARRAFLKLKSKKKSKKNKKKK